MRPDWPEYFLQIAESVSRRADCTRRQVGAVIVDTDHRIIATGYNGSAPGAAGCLSGACPRGRHYQIGPTVKVPFGSVSRPGGWCACGNEWPCPEAVTPGSSYDTGTGTCIALHAEQNAILFARQSLVGCTIYVTHEPCDGCKRLIAGAGIERIITGDTVS